MIRPIHMLIVLFASIAMSAPAQARIFLPRELINQLKQRPPSNACVWDQVVDEYGELDIVQLCEPGDKGGNNNYFYPGVPVQYCSWPPSPDSHCP